MITIMFEYLLEICIFTGVEDKKKVCSVLKTSNRQSQCFLQVTTLWCMRISEFLSASSF